VWHLRGGSGLEAIAWCLAVEEVALRTQPADLIWSMTITREFEAVAVMLR
jgi:hypothetical protein